MNDTVTTPRPKTLERVCVYGILIYAMQIGFGLYFHEFQSSSSISDEGNSLARGGWLAMDAIILILCAFRYRLVVSLLRSKPLLVVFFFYIAIGFTWSMYPSDTLRRSFGLIAGGFFGVYLASVFSTSQVLAMLRNTIVFGLLVSIVCVIAFPSQATVAGHAWQGAFAHKNLLGELAGILIILAAAHRREKGLSRRNMFELILGAICLLLSQSGTGILGVAFVGLVYFLYGRRRSGIPIIKPLIILAALGFGFLALIGIFSPKDVLLGSVGKDATLTGRTDIWEAAWPLFLQHFWHGWGYGGFWHGWYYPSGIVWGYVNPLHPPHAHNSFLEIGLNLGAIGLLLFGSLFAWTFVKSFYRFRRTTEKFACAGSMLMLLFLFQGMTEITLLYHQSINWLIVAYLISSPANKPVLSSVTSGNEA